ncbi:MAG: hypothetical protein RMK18_07645 [Armatimonadota bacterium]|nr:hypothetical protein [Armatimonadota bacterium]MCX7776669.1 hypothetical protein [Armatimonadota bacterium]MDW8025716.1 hypothetical protein [Armatimonadota bacterium]
MKERDPFVTCIACLWFVVCLAVSVHNSMANAQLKFEVVEQESDASFCFAMTLRQTDAGCSHTTLCIFSITGNQQEFYMLHIGRNDTQLAWYGRGQKRAIANGKGLQRGNSWRLLLIRDVDGIRLLSNDELLLKADVKLPSGGAFKYALGCAHLSAEESRYQPTEQVFFTDDFTQGDDNLTSWDRSGQWALQSVDSPQPNPNLSANPFALRATVTPQQPKATALTGYWFWHSYAAQASVKVQGRATAGLIAYARSLEDCWMLTLQPQSSWRYFPKGTVRLVRVTNGDERVIAEQTLPLEDDQWYELRMSADNGVVRGWVDGIEVVRASANSFPMGQVGLYAMGDGRVYFDDIIVAPLQQLIAATMQTKITEQYTLENTMTEWATLFGSFVRDPQDARLWWHSGIFFGDFELTLWLNEGGRNKGSFTFYLCPSQATGMRPVALHFVRRSESPRQIANLHIGLPTPFSIGVNAPIRVGGINDILVSVTCGSSALTSPIRLSINGIREEPVRIKRMSNRLVLMHGNRVIGIAEHASIKLAQFISYRTDGYEPDWSRCDLVCSNLIDDTFSVAPTRWRSTRGVWQVTARWPCAPGWAWFGGTQHRFPTLWSKASFEGNMVIEIFAAIKMRERGNPYPNPRDINVSFCADGWNVGSGYSFLLAGWGNSGSGLLRKGERVAYNPDFVFRKVSTLNFAGFHRHWFHIRILKLGSNITCYVDGQPAVQWNDPQPINSGRVAIWTVDNGVLIARARIWYEKVKGLETAPTPLSNLPEETPSEVTSVDGWRSIWNDESQPVLRRAPNGKIEVVNCMPGGRMFVRAPVNDISVAQSPFLRLKLRLSEGTLVNLYLRLNGRTVMIPLSIPLPHPERVLVAGQNTAGVQVTKDANGTVNVQVDMRSLCEAIGIASQNAVLNEVLIGNLTTDEYLLAGLLGNPLGCSYTIEEFSVTR